jgi:hypothetical protein
MNVAMAIDTLRAKASDANELHRLRDRVEELEQLLGIVAEDVVDRFIALGISPGEKRILNVLFTWKLVRREKLYTLLYGNRPECDQPDVRTIDVQICRLRKYLSAFNIAIGTQRDAGWFITEENKEKLKNLADWLLSGERIA